MSVAASAIAERKTVAHLSYRVASMLARCSNTAASMRSIRYLARLLQLPDVSAVVRWTRTARALRSWIVIPPPQQLQRS